VSKGGRRITTQSPEGRGGILGAIFKLIVYTPRIKSLLPSLYFKREEFPSLEKRGQGRFSEEHVFSIMDSLVTAYGKEFLLYRVYGKDENEHSKNNNRDHYPSPFFHMNYLRTF